MKSACTLDGTAIPAAKTLLLGALEAGLSVPHLCHHPALPPGQACGLCVVVDESTGKLVPACATPVASGCHYTSHSPAVQEARFKALKRLMDNHPLECPVCEKSGECVPQATIFQWNGVLPESKPGPTVPPVAIGPGLLLYPQRCVACGLCVSFMEAVAGKSPLILEQSSSPPISFVGPPMDHRYALTLPELCPVGALVAAFNVGTSPAWTLSPLATVCGECTATCTVFVDVDSTNIRRVRSRPQPEEPFWICDQGRRALVAQAENRLTEIRLRPQGRPEETVDADAGVEAVACWTRNLPPGQRLAFVLDGFATMESAADFLALVLAAGESTVFLGLEEAEEGDAVRYTGQHGPNRLGLERLCVQLGLELKPLDSLFAKGSMADVGGLISAGSRYALRPLPGDAILSMAVVMSSSAGEVADKSTHVFPIPSTLEEQGTWITPQGVRTLAPMPSRHKSPSISEWSSRLGVALFPSSFSQAQEKARAALREVVQ